MPADHSAADDSARSFKLSPTTAGAEHRDHVADGSPLLIRVTFVGS